MSDERGNPIERPHTHKWNLQNDKDFAAESTRLLSYFIAAQQNIPCVHQDHPSVQAVESMIRGALKGHQMFPGLADAVETFAHIFFAAGQQYARDGHASSAHPSFEPDNDLAGAGMTMDEWSKLHQEMVSEWRAGIRERFYGEKKKGGLVEFLSHLVKNHGDELSLITLDEGNEAEILSRLLGPQRTAPEEEQDNRAGPYL